MNRSSPRRLVVAGAGGFARETIDVIEDINEGGDLAYEIVGVTGPAPGKAQLERLAARDIRYLGADDTWLVRANADYFAVAVGSPALRRRIVARYLAAGLIPTKLIHPSALMGRRTEVEEGVVICAGVVISTNVRIGAFATVNPNATIGHDAVLRDFVSINPGAVVSGEVVLGSRTLVGAGAVILENLTLGSDCVVGASACVTKSLDAGLMVTGVPARPVLRR